MEMLFLVYWILGYIAVKNTIDANKIIIYSGNSLFMRRAFLGLMLGWILIPWMLIKMFVSK